MEVNTLPKAAAAILGDIRRLTKMVVEQLQDPALFGDPALESSIEHILDRFCLSVQLAKPVGLSTWAVREGRRLGSQRTSELTDAVAHVVATEAARFGIDQGRLLALLEVLKTEIRSALSAVSDDCGESQSAYTETAEALLAMLGERDSQTCCHSKATGEWARRICTALELDEEASDFVELCAILHDIGKIATPESILLKTGALTPKEWSVMREHPAAGQRILKQIPSLAHCAAIVRAHHERWDGLGYPDGIAGESIPLEARIVAVADAFHAMISERPYRKAISPRQALEILDAGSGTQWDPFVVDAMLGTFSVTRRRPVVEQGHASSA